MEHIKKYGLSFYEMITSDNTSEEYFQIGRDFVKELFSLMSKYSTKFSNHKYDFFDLPYIYSERRLDSVLLPALSIICDSIVLTELPVERQKQGEISSGRADYWCIYNGYTFIIELKQSFDAYETPITRQNSGIRRWNSMLGQLDDIVKDARQFTEKTKGVIRLGLHMFTSYSSNSMDKAIKFDQMQIHTIANRFYKHLAHKSKKCKPDMLLCWRIPLKIVKKGCEELNMLYPGLWAIAKIYPPILHEGSINSHS